MSAPVAALQHCKAFPALRPKKCPLLVCVMDGVGVGINDKFNAVFMANAPTIKSLMNPSNPGYRTVRAHGTSVGLPTDEDMGNSEVGHNALGAGRIILQGASLVDESIARGEMWASKGWAHLKSSWSNNGNGNNNANPNATLHFIGLLSNGGVHSRTDQLYAMITRAAKDDGCKRIRIHPLFDGRDVPDGTSIKFAQELEQFLEKLGKATGCDARIASGGGRMFITMDRYNADWKMVERGWKTHVHGEGRAFASASEAIETFKKENPKVSDQYLPAFVVADPATKKPVGTIQDGDAVLMFNFRGDRMIQICRAFEDSAADFKEFDRVRVPKVKFAGLMLYDGDLSIPRVFLVPPPHISHTSSEYLAKSGATVFACSETQKFGHVTYFWNGNRSGKFDERLETYLEIPSDPTSVFVDKPEMKATEIANAAEKALRSGQHDIVIVHQNTSNNNNDDDDDSSVPSNNNHSRRNDHPTSSMNQQMKSSCSFPLASSTSTPTTKKSVSSKNNAAVATATSSSNNTSANNNNDEFTKVQPSPIFNHPSHQFCAGPANVSSPASSQGKTDPKSSRQDESTISSTDSMPENLINPFDIDLVEHFQKRSYQAPADLGGAVLSDVLPGVFWSELEENHADELSMKCIVAFANASVLYFSESFNDLITAAKLSDYTTKKTANAIKQKIEQCPDFAKYLTSVEYTQALADFRPVLQQLKILPRLTSRLKSRDMITVKKFLGAKAPQLEDLDMLNLVQHAIKEFFETGQKNFRAALKSQRGTAKDRVEWSETLLNILLHQHVTQESIRFLIPGQVIRHTRAFPFDQRARQQTKKQLLGALKELKSAESGSLSREKKNFILLISMPRQGKTLFLDSAANDEEIMETWSEKGARQCFVFNITFNSTWEIGDRTYSFHEAVNEVVLRLLGAATGIFDGKNAEKIRLPKICSVFCFEDLAVPVTLIEQRVQQVFNFSKIPQGVPAKSFCTMLLLDEFTELTKRIDSDQSRTAFFSTMGGCITSDFAVIISGFNRTQPAFAHSGRQNTDLLLPALMNSVVRRPALAMQTAYFQRCALADESLYYHELVKASLGLRGAILENIFSANSITVKQALERIPLVKTISNNENAYNNILKMLEIDSIC
jgi:2,3-bisphosphoglycerate-independent phosphoglycerate mutase